MHGRSAGFSGGIAQPGLSVSEIRDLRDTASYPRLLLSGIVGGVTAVPVWEFLKRVGPPRAN